MLVVRLKWAIDAYRNRTGQRMSIAELARRLGMRESSLRVIATPGRSTTLHTVAKIARALDMRALDLLGEVPDKRQAEGVPAAHGAGRSRGARRRAQRDG